MRTFLRIIVLVAIPACLAGCGASLLLRVYTVDARSVHPGPGNAAPDSAALVPVGGVRFFFYPYVRDSVIHPVPERDFATGPNGRGEYVETVSPLGDKMGALVAMKYGYLVDTVIFEFGLNDTVDLLIPMRPR